MQNAYSIVLIAVILMVVIACGNTTQKESATSPAPMPADCIALVIATDDSLGTVRNHACEKKSLSETIRGYVKGMEEISYKNCPGPFTRAFARHRKAWAALIPITDSYSELRGEMHDLFKELHQSADSVAFKKGEKAIWDTWAEVEVAMK